MKLRIRNQNHFTYFRGSNLTYSVPNGSKLELFFNNNNLGKHYFGGRITTSGRRTAHEYLHPIRLGYVFAARLLFLPLCEYFFCPLNYKPNNLGQPARISILLITWQ